MAHQRYLNSYYWRTHGGAEVDLVEEYDGLLHPYEIKYSSDKPGRGAKVFEETYPEASSVTVVNKLTYPDFTLSRP